MRKLTAIEQERFKIVKPNAGSKPMSFDPEHVIPPGANIKVIGVGGGGGNAVNTMIRAGLDGVDFITANTDVQALRFSLSEKKIQVGKELTKGLGAGADPDVGRDAALEDRHEIQDMLAGADMVFITAGMGGGTGTGGAAVIAQIAREMGALTVAVTTKPFNFEGKRRRKHAESGIEKLRENVDTLITIPNQRLLQIATPELSMVEAFRMADDVLLNAVKGISDIINVPGTVNVDFADVKSVMASMGMALMGIGRAQGENRAVEAARQAICSPLLEDIDIEGATGILINITAGSSIGLMEVNEACSIIQDAAHEDANIIFGAVIDEEVGDEIRVTVIATGFPADYDENDDYPASRPVQQTVATPRSFTSGIFGGSQKTTPAKPLAQKPQTAAPTPQPQEPKTPVPVPVATPITDETEATEPLLHDTEAEDLTRLTMEAPLQTEIPEEEAKVEEPLEIQGATAAIETTEPMLNSPIPPELEELDEYAVMATPAPQAPVVEEPAVEPPASAVPIQQASEEIDLFEEEELLAEEDEIIGGDMPPPPAPEAPMDSIFAQGQQAGAPNELDQKIDEALELANRIKDHEGFSGDDDLDIPAFLRDGMKDLSLD